MTYKVKLNIFEGPLDLLLYLIQKHEIDIYDIPIALITREYLDYLDLIKTLNLDVVGDFLVMAATLTQIKSRMLLPPDQTDDDEEGGVDPRRELIERLLEYKKYKEAAHSLKDQENLWIDAYPFGAADHAKDEREVLLINLNLMDLIEAFRNVLSKTSADDVHEITVETMTIKEKISWIMETLDYRESIRFEDLFHENPGRQEIIITFLALLEIIRLRLVRIEQTERFSPIRIQKAVSDQEKPPEGAPPSYAEESDSISEET
ncbi:MAG: segregation/condensation protein A [bacterium]